MKPPFGTMNNTIAKTIAQNAPKYSKIVEPFGDSGSFALYIAKIPAKTHLLNIVEPELFTAFTFMQNYSSSDLNSLKKMDWTGSLETFNQILTITDVEGTNFIYKFLYLKKFGMKMKDGSVSFDVLSTGKNIANILYSFPLMKSLIKKVTLSNVDPLTLIPSDGFMILLPPHDQIENVKAKLSSLDGNFFFAGKAADGDEIVQDAQSLSSLHVSGLPAASIMMNKFAVITDYDSKITPIDPDVTGMNM